METKKSLPARAILLFVLEAFPIAYSQAADTHRLLNLTGHWKFLSATVPPGQFPDLTTGTGLRFMSRPDERKKDILDTTAMHGTENI